MDEELSACDLVRLLLDGPDVLRIEAAKELARRKDRTVLADLCRILRGSQSGQAREVAAWLLGELSPGTGFTLDALHATITDPDAGESLRGQAIGSLGNQVILQSHAVAAKSKAAEPPGL